MACQSIWNTHSKRQWNLGNNPMPGHQLGMMDIGSKVGTGWKQWWGILASTRSYSGMEKPHVNSKNTTCGSWLCSQASVITHIEISIISNDADRETMPNNTSASVIPRLTRHGSKLEYATGSGTQPMHLPRTQHTQPVVRTNDCTHSNSG